MTKAPVFVKWIFAILAFAGGSIVAQLLQPPTSKTEGLGGISLVAQLEAAAPQSANETASNAKTAVVSIGVTPVTSTIEHEPVAIVQNSNLVSSAVTPAKTSDRETLPTVVTSVKVVASGKTPTVRASEPQRKAVRSYPTVVAPVRKTPTPQKPVTSTGLASINQKPDVKPGLSKQKSASRSILETASTKQSVKSVVTRPSKDSDENLSLTSLPKLSVEASDFQTIRSDLPGQFKPLKGISRTVAPREPQRVAKSPSVPFSPASILPTEIVPAANLVGSGKGVVPPKSQNLFARPAGERSDSVAKLASPVSVAVTKNADRVTAGHAPPKHEILKIAKAKTVATQSNKLKKSKQLVSQTTGSKPKELNAELTALRSKVQRVLKMYREQEISVREKSAWSVMHSFIGYGVEKQVRIDHQGNRASAIGWVCFNNPCRGVRLFYLKNGEIYGRLGPGNQGHEGQFLAMLAQSRVQSDYPMKIEGRDFTVLDLVEREKRSCRPKTELTFKLIGLSHYLEIDETWKDDRGSSWDIPRLIKEEMQQPIIGAACGGTHRLFGLSYAVNRRIHKGKPVDGQYRRAEVYIKDYQKYTFKMQNPDGSFSTRFFSGRGAANDADRRLLTTGHISEWLAFSLEGDELTDPRMVRAIDYLASLLLRGKYPAGWKVGPLGHALHAMNIYNDRVFKNTAKTPVVASRPR